MTAPPRLRLAGVLGLLPLAGCAMSGQQKAAEFIARMDAMPPEERVPNWDHTKALMLRNAPQVGADAPDFTLSTCDGGGAVRLSQFEGQRPVVLIFGSWT